MKNRFNVSREELSAYIQDAIFCIEAFTNLRFVKAEDWTMKNQGHVLHFAGELRKNWDDVEKYIKMQFAHNPNTKSLDEDTSDFEELIYGSNEDEYIVYIAI